MKLFLYKFFLGRRALFCSSLGISLLLWGSFNPLWGELWVLGSRKHNFGPLELRGRIEIFRSGDLTQDIRLKTTAYHHSSDNLVYLNFEEAAPSELREQGGRLRVQKSLYFISKDAHNGKQAALFNGPDHGVRLEAAQVFGKGQEALQDFTIEMWIKPIFFFRNTILFEKTGFFGGRKNSLKIGIQKGRLFVDLENLFQDSKGKIYSIRLETLKEDKVKIGKWQHLSFSYQAAKGRLGLYFNGREQEVRYARDKSQSWQMRFAALDRSPLILAKTFTGLIDEFRITRGAFSPQKGELYLSRYEPLRVNFETQSGTQKSAQVRSGLLHFPQKKIVRFAQISYEAQEAQGTALDLYVRHSQKRFAPNDLQPAWRRIEKSELSLPAFRYFQWQAILRSDPLGQATPVLKSIAVNYIPTRPPPVPQGLRIVASLTKDLQVCLEWERSPVQEQGSISSGYYIYYGLRPGEYMGRLEFYQTGGEIRNLRDLAKSSQSIPLSPAEKQLQATRPELSKRIFHNRTRLLVTNRSIAKDLSLNSKKKLPFLRHGQNYYFAVSAYDRFSESPLSKEVYTRTRPQAQKIE